MTAVRESLRPLFTLAPSPQRRWVAVRAALTAAIPLVGVFLGLNAVVVMVGLAVALVKDLSQDPLVVRRAYAVAAVEQAVVEGITRHGEDFVLYALMSFVIENYRPLLDRIHGELEDIEEVV